MKRLQPVAVGLIGLAMVAASWAAAPREERPWMMPVSEIRIGMKGYGLTVFRGDTPQRFNAEIVGILHNGVGAGVDMILARLEHEELRDIGVIAGMSGSPVFLNDRVIGAVAYGYQFSKVAIAGITPMEKMLEVYDRTSFQAPPRDVALGPVEPIRPGERVSIEPKVGFAAREPVSVQRDDLPESARAIFRPDEHEIHLQPLSMPVMVSACSRQTAELVEKIFKPLGMEPLFAPIGASSEAADLVTTIPIVNGTAIGIPMLLGDMNLGSIGTVSYTDGKKLVAFGHPMTARGPVEFPLGAARIYATLPSVMRPFKMGEIAGLSGSIYQDRLTAVGGIVGKIPFMVPMTVKVVDEAKKTDRTYRFRLMDHRLYAPRMAMVAMVEACTAGDRTEGEQTATIHYRIETDDGQLIEKDNMASGQVSVMMLSVDLLSDMAPVYSNEFQVRSVKSVSAEVHLRDGLQSANLDSAFVDRSIVKPGETIQVSAYVRPWRKEQQRLSTTLRIPATLPNGRYNVAICDSRQREAADVVRAPGLYRAHDFADVVRILRIHYRPDRLYVMLTSPEGGVTIDGREFDQLPPSIQNTLTQLRDREKTAPTIGQVLAETTLDVPFVLSGSQITQIEVDRRGGR